jgi:hypothetical protein
VTCCVIKRGFETCADCPEYPCSRFDKEREGRDSFVTHRKVFDNLNAIRKNGLEAFLDNQSVRIDLLKRLLRDFNDGRSKSYFCLACALLPDSNIPALIDVLPGIPDNLDAKEKNKLARALIDLLSRQRGIELILRNK